MKRSTVALLGTLVALVVIAYVVTLKPGETSVVHGEGDALVVVDSAAADRVEVNTPSSNVVLQKRGVEWFVTSPVEDRADPKNVASVLERANNLRVKSIVSENPEKHGIFQVDSTGTRVTIGASGSEPVSFIVGKSSSSFTDTYVRKEGTNQVAMVDGSFPWVFTKELKDWRDRSLLRVASEQIAGVGFRYGDTTFTLVFSDSLWTIGGEPANQTTVTSFLSTLSSLQCDDFLESKPRQRVSAEITVGDVRLSFAFDKSAKTYAVQRSTDGRWFQLSDWRANQVLKRKKDLL
jgi:hypothetical protein